jgi:MFS family permease
MDKGREEEARRVIVKYHCGGDEMDPLAAYECEEIKTALQLEKEANKGSSFKSLFVGKGNRRRMLVIIAIAFFSQWSGNGLVSYYLNSVLDGIGIHATSTKTLINGILNIFNYATAIFGALTVDRIGRRPLFLISTAGMTVCFAIWTACSAIYHKSAEEVDPTTKLPIHPNKSAGNAVLAMIFLFYMFYNLAMSPLLVAYTVEM